jgi:hypothetical protein
LGTTSRALSSFVLSSAAIALGATSGTDADELALFIAVGFLVVFVPLAATYRWLRDWLVPAPLPDAARVLPRERTALREVAKSVLFIAVFIALGQAAAVFSGVLAGDALFALLMARWLRHAETSTGDEWFRELGFRSRLRKHGRPFYSRSPSLQESESLPV